MRKKRVQAIASTESLRKEQTNNLFAFSFPRLSVHPLNNYCSRHEIGNTTMYTKQPVSLNKININLLVDPN